MGEQSKKRKSRPTSKRLNSFGYFWSEFIAWLHMGTWQKIFVVVIAVTVLWVGTMYGVAEWYIFSTRKQPIQLGATFISDYAKQLGVEPHETLDAMIHDLGVRHLRLVSYWDKIEPVSGTYDFSDLDWQMKAAENAGVKVSLAIGLRQPRWPECHMPEWAKTETKTVWYGQLQTFITAVIDRYQNSSALESYQLENEYFLSVFGKCTDFNRQRLVDEANLVKRLDPAHTLIISRSNNGIGLPVGKPTPDLFGVSVYKRVWDKTITHRYFEYPFPAWFYGSLAGGGKILTGKDLIIHELQTEAWLPDNFDIKTAPISELYKSMNPERLHDRIKYGEGTGIKQIDLWGVEWWYQMKTKRGEPGLWQAAKEEIQSAEVHNAQL